MSSYINSISERIVKKLLCDEIIEQEEYDIYLFGVYQNIVLILNMITSFIIFAMFHLVIEGLLFSIFYSSLRSYSGGYHSRTLSSCYIFSVLLTVGVALIINEIKLNYLWIIIFILACVFIYVTAPIDTSNKRLDDAEKKRYRKKSRIILFICILISIVFYLTQYEHGTITIILVVITEAVMLVLGIADNYLQFKERKNL